MATTKKTTKAKAAPKKKAAQKKKAAPKKTAPKKAAPKKATAKAAPKKAAPAPAPVIKHRTLHVATNAGQFSINFTNDSRFEEALRIVTEAPKDGGGSRTPPALRRLVGTNGTFSFRTVRNHSVEEH